VGERSGGGVTQALTDGVARVATAPAVLAATLALTFLFSVALPLFTPYAAFLQYSALVPLLPLGVPPRSPQTVTWLLVWSFLGGGILDRYARTRPTRGRGFFGACGAHFPAMLRLGVLEWLFWLSIARAGLDRYLPYGSVVIALAAALIFLYARVRIVVEDRRSALGALLAGGRFIRRNVAAVPLFLMFAAAMWIGTWLWAQLAPNLGEPALAPFAGNELIVALLLFVIFASWASAIALFQARLAHASYTAGPPLEWPESPAAEAITNLSPSPTP
jgi:hypothetical protein